MDAIAPTATAMQHGDVAAVAGAAILSRWRRRLKTRRHPGSKRQYDKTLARRRNRIARESRRRNRGA